MVCSKCQKSMKKTELATPHVKRKSDIVDGSSAGHKASASVGVSKNKLLSQAAKNPYAAYASSCKTCQKKTESGRKYCQRCAYKANACIMCGKGLSGDKGTGQGVVQGQKFSAK